MSCFLPENNPAELVKCQTCGQSVTLTSLFTPFKCVHTHSPTVEMSVIVSMFIQALVLRIMGCVNETTEPSAE